MFSLDSLKHIHQLLLLGQVRTWSQDALKDALQEARPHTDEVHQAASVANWKGLFFAYLHASMRISDDPDEEGTAQDAVREVTRFLGAAAGALFLWNRKNGKLIRRAAVLPPGWIATRDEDYSFNLEDYPVFRPVLEEASVIRVLPSGSGETSTLPGSVSELRTLFLFPLLASQQVIGFVLVMDTRQDLDICDERLALAQLLLNGAAVYLLAAQELEAMKRRAAIFELICGSIRDLSTNLDVQDVLDTSLHAVVDLFAEMGIALRQAQIYLKQEGSLSFQTGLRVEGSVRQLLAEHPVDELVYRAASQMKLARGAITGPYAPSQVSLHQPSESAVALPLAGNDGLLGVLRLTSMQPPDAFEDENLEILRRLCDHIVIAIENVQRHAALSEQALTDALTGLPNRRALDLRLEEEIRRAGRYQHPFTLVMIDLNEFKDINDTFGHPYGDGVLQQVALCLRNSLRDTDFLARFGGDEFVAILPETDQQTAERLANRLGAAIATCNLYPEGAEARSPSVSLGLAVYPDQGITGLSLLVAADQALYRAKAKGRLADRR